MIIPDKIKIGDTEYKVRNKKFKEIGGQINYSNRTLDIHRSNFDRAREDTFFHEVSHGILKELEFNHPKIICFRNNEDFTQEMGLILRKTVLDLIRKQSGRFIR